LHFPAGNYFGKKINKTTNNGKKYDQPYPAILTALPDAMIDTYTLQQDRDYIEI
jgi:hypothetical protein